jgi:GTPase
VLIFRVCPIFQISNVAGTGLDMLKTFLNLLPAYHDYDVSQPVEYQITESYSVPGVGTVGIFLIN